MDLLLFRVLKGRCHNRSRLHFLKVVGICKPRDNTHRSKFNSLSSYSFFSVHMESVKTHDSNSHILYLARLLLRISISQLHLLRKTKSKSVIRAYVNISITMTVPEHLGSPFRTQ